MVGLFQSFGRKLATCMYNSDATGTEHVTVLDRIGPPAGLVILTAALVMQAIESSRR